MEITLLGPCYQHVSLRHSPASSLLIPSISLSSKRTRSTHLTTSAPVAGDTEPIYASCTPDYFSSTHSVSPTTHAKFAASVQKRRSVSYKERQAAIVEIRQASDLHSALERFGEMLKSQDTNVILRHFGKLDRVHDLCQVFEWMQKKGEIDASSYTTYIKFIGKNFGAVKALEVYNSIEDESTKKNVFVCNSMLNCLVRNGKFDSSMKLFHEMKQNGLVPDVVTYSTLLAGCIRGKDGYPTALELIQGMHNSELHMDEVIYGTLLAVCASNNKFEEAERFFNQMKHEGVCPNIFHYSSLLNAYSASGNYRKADSLVQDMKSAGVVPNQVMLTTLLKVYVRGGLFEKARELLTELESLGYADHEMPFCLLMDSLSKAGQIQEARSVFYDMTRKHVRSDGYAHSIMIAALCRAELFDEAKKLAREFEATYEKYDLVLLNTMLCAYCRAGEMESVMRILKKMDELAVSPDNNTFHILIKYFSKERMYLLAFRTMEDMHRKGYQLEEGLCSYLIYHLGKSRAHQEAFAVYNMLKYGKRTMCKALHEKILHILIAGRLLKDAYVVVKDNASYISQSSIKKFASAFMKFGNINLLNDVMKTIHGSGYKIDQDLFRMAISKYIEQPEKKELFLQLLQWMPGQGYTVDPTTRNLVLKNSHLFGRQTIAEILSKQQRMSKALISTRDVIKRSSA